MASLSVAIIARNEAENLPRALESVRTVADEIVVTDTGSTDATVKIAKSFGARVTTFSWCDDFSAAYNFCLDQVRGDWVLLVDADEQLLPGCESELRSRTERPDALAYSVLRQDLRDVERLDQFTEMLQLRLFRTRPDLRFIGRIHHQFRVPLDEIAGRENLQVLPSSIRLRHYGYAAGRKAEKLARAARLMELELNDRPGQFYFLVELGRSWIAMGDQRGIAVLAEAAAIFRDYPDRALAAGGTAPMLLEHILASDQLPAGFPIDSELAKKLALTHFPRAVPLLWQIALRSYRQDRFETCAEMLERIVQLARSDAYDRLASFDPRILNGDAVLNLGVCYSRLGRIADAKRCFTELLTQPDYELRARQNLDALRRLRKS